MKEKVRNSPYSFDKLATKLDVSRITISRWLNGEELSDFRMKMVADAIGIDLRNYYSELEYLYSEKEFNLDYKKLWETQLEENQILRKRLELYEELLKK